MDYCDVGDLQQYAATSRQATEQVRDYLQRRLRCVGGQYFCNADTLLDILCTCDAVISGSTTLHILLPKQGTPWAPMDLDLYVLQMTSVLLMSHLMEEGYAIVTKGESEDMPYTPMHEEHVEQLTNGKHSIDVVVSGTASAPSPIFHFHSTAVMNFISADTIFCTYPRLTLQQLSLMNAGALYDGGDMDDIGDAVQKYMRRGLHYVWCKDSHNISHTCKVATHIVTDSSTMWLNLNAAPQVTHTSHELFRQFGVLDMWWCLGGMPCGLEAAFCHPCVEVIEDEL
ncbi:hypothetical protein EDD16DRAFT_1496369 [Pisolithus croceorrhizus]|nr:hypothetical protein EDD16DRAFT_1496369 [Pisolithus croceorrhizus]KAI6107491.1 hypothetical protein EV401DRAFT_1871594 [Pisolithus croceorrhizus]